MIGIIRKSVLGAAIAMTVAFVAGPAFADKLRYCNEADLPPFSFKTPSGEIQGFDIDVANYICGHMGVTCEPVVQEWSGLITALLAGKCDAVISSMTINEERKKQMLFSDPYYNTPTRFVAPKGVDFEITTEGLKGKTLCMFKNSMPTKWLDAKFKDAVKINYYEAPEAIKTDLMAGRCDAWLEVETAIWGALLNTPDGKDFHLVGPPLTEREWFGDGMGIAAPLGSEELIGKINAALTAMYADGTFKKINEKYVPINLSRDQ